MSTEQFASTPIGDARLVSFPAPRPDATLVLTHGAGGGITAPDLSWIADSVPAQGLSVVLVEMPWRVQGKKLAPRPSVIDECYLAVLGQVPVRTPIIVGGRSAGARSACRIAAEVGAVAAVALSFPLHPPGKPEKSRIEELLNAGVPTLVVQGERDPFGRPEEFPDSVELGVVPAADHSMKVLKSAPLSQDDALAIVAESVLEWVTREIVGNRPA